MSWLHHPGPPGPHSLGALRLALGGHHPQHLPGERGHSEGPGPRGGGGGRAGGPGPGRGSPHGLFLQAVRAKLLGIVGNKALNSDIQSAPKELEVLEE